MKDACPACGKYILTRMPRGWRCAGCDYYLADKDTACVSCGKPGEINCDSCQEVICLECIDTPTSPIARKPEPKKPEPKPSKRAEQAEQMANALATRIRLVFTYLKDHGMEAPDCPELVKYDRLYHPDGKPRP